MSHTGYVHGLVDNNLTFKQFASTCAYAFGALIHYRDSSNDKTKLPDSIEEKESYSSSNYYVSSLKSAKRELKRLSKMSDEDKISYGINKQKKDIKGYEKCLEQTLKEKKIVLGMLEKVKVWTPPSPNHINYKNFMISQLETSTFFDDDYRENIEKLKNTPISEFYSNELQHQTEQVEYYTKKIEEEKAKKLDDNRGLWLEQLKQSLESYD